VIAAKSAPKAKPSWGIAGRRDFCAPHNDAARNPRVVGELARVVFADIRALVHKTAAHEDAF